MTNELGGIANTLWKFLAPGERSKVEELIARIRLDQELTGDSDWPACFGALDSNCSSSSDDSTDSDIHHRILVDLVEPWLGSIKSLKELRTLDILLSTLAPERQKYLDEYYPTSVDAPDGSKVPVRYIRNNNDVGIGDGTTKRERTSCRPMATAKLQQFFGVQETPRVGPANILGREELLPLTLSLVSPAGKPLAETMDLPFFWKEVYPSIRSEMRGKYPKHPWPEDPLIAVATRKTKKQLYNEESSVSGEVQSDGKGKGRKKRKKK